MSGVHSVVLYLLTYFTFIFIFINFVQVTKGSIFQLMIRIRLPGASSLNPSIFFTNRFILFSTHSYTSHSYKVIPPDCRKQYVLSSFFLVTLLVIPATTHQLRKMENHLSMVSVLLDGARSPINAVMGGGINQTFNFTHEYSTCLLA